MSLTLKDLRVATPDKWAKDFFGKPFDNHRPASLADLVEVLKAQGAYEYEVDEDEIWGAPGRYLILRLGDTP